MTRSHIPDRRGFTLIEMLIVIAIIGVLIALLLPAISMVKEASYKITCEQNLKQLTLAVHTFHDVNGAMPPYFGIFPYGTVGGDCHYYPTYPDCANPPTNAYGGWFLHLLPYVDQGPVYQKVLAANKAAGRSYPTGLGAGASSNAGFNGHDWIGGTYGAGIPTSGQGYTQDYSDIWNSQVRNVKFQILICPSDPSDPWNHPGLTYGDWWGSSNYAANWNVWGPGFDWQSGSDMYPQKPAGYTNVPYAWSLWQPGQSLKSIADGTSNTILFAEQYAVCDTSNGQGAEAQGTQTEQAGNYPLGRLALYNWFHHAFGFNWEQNCDSGNTNNDPDTPHPGTYKCYENTTLYGDGPRGERIFQVRPEANIRSQCSNGQLEDNRCCNNWAVQTGHQAMPIALADGSVRTLSNKITAETWRQLQLPRDGEVINDPNY